MFCNRVQFFAFSIYTQNLKRLVVQSKQTVWNSKTQKYPAPYFFTLSKRTHLQKNNEEGRSAHESSSEQESSGFWSTLKYSLFG